MEQTGCHTWSCRRCMPAAVARLAEGGRSCSRASSRAANAAAASASWAARAERLPACPLPACPLPASPLSGDSRVVELCWLTGALSGGNRSPAGVKSAWPCLMRAHLCLRLSSRLQHLLSREQGPSLLQKSGRYRRILLGATCAQVFKQVQTT